MDGLIEQLIELVNNFDPSAYLPQIDSIMGWVETFLRICVMAAPVIMLVFGLSYLLLPAKEANHQAGYRFYFGMGSVEAWRFTQKFAGIFWSLLGLILSIVMYKISGSFGEMELMDMVYKAITCILWEIGLVAVSYIAINLTLIIRYNRHGDVRWQKQAK